MRSLRYKRSNSGSGVGKKSVKAEISRQKDAENAKKLPTVVRLV